MTRRGPKTTTHVHRVHSQPGGGAEAKAKGPKDLLLHRHRLLRRASGFMLARKYRNPWPSESDFARELGSRFTSRTERAASNSAVAPSSSSSASSLIGLNGPKGYSREELLNFWRELSLVAKRRLLRIRRETYLTALDQFLVGQNLCCECHDNYELERDGRRAGGNKVSMLSDEYLAALEVGKRQEDELLRLIQKEERFIIIREDHSDFIMDLIRCGEQFSYVSPFRSGFEDDESDESDEDEDEDNTCPGANTSHLAQEYLLEVLAIKFREQHSFAIQAELLRDELADLKASQKPSSSNKKKKSKEKKKRRKKDAASPGTAAQKATEKVSPRTQTRTSTSPKAKGAMGAKQPSSSIGTSGESDTEVRDPEEDAIDREVEQFRLLLVKINAESALRSRKKLVLPPGSFAHLASMAVFMPPTLRSRRPPAAGCAVCGEQSQRVAVGCAKCARSFHLSCLTPPLRRRPVLAAAWRCSSCTTTSDQKEDHGDTEIEAEEETALRTSERAGSTRSKRKRQAQNDKSPEPQKAHAARGNEQENGHSEAEEKQPAAKKRRVAMRSTKRTGVSVANDRVEAQVSRNGRSSEAEEQRDEDDEDFEQLPIANTVARHPAGKAAMKRKKAQTPAKVRVSVRASRRSSTPKSSPPSASEEDVEGSDEDDDGDSDFVGDSQSEDEEEEEVTSAGGTSEEDFVRPARRRSVTPTAPSRRPAQKSKGAGRRSIQQPTPAAARDAPSGNTPASDVDSLNIVVEADEISEEEEIYVRPQYRIEYAPNGRAKHVECTLIGLAAVASANSEDEQPPNELETKPKLTPASADPIDGLSTLKLADQKRVREYMKQNDENGVTDERLDITDDHFNKKTRMPEKQPSKYLTATLLPYQREALAWMVAQEASDYKGGILADEMGMGKTLQAISLILENIRLRDQFAKKKSAKSKGPALVRGGTLVVCPLVAVMQWKSEIERFVERDHLSIYIHHGPKRLDVAARIASYDIVLTTYSIIESEIRKTLGWSKVVCKYCGKKYLPDKLVTHNKYFCGPNAKKTALQDKQQKKKAKKRAAGESSSDDEALKKPARKSKGKGPQRAKKKVDSDDDDAEIAVPQKTKGKSPLHQILWTRIVLDEAHYIKDRNCNTARGVFELKSDYKWCLTGTPLQNRIGELFSLIRFLQVKSFAFYHCNACDCQMLDYKYILLRRTKEGRADDISLPPKLVRIRRDWLDERENDFYEAIYTQSQAQFNTYVSSGTLLNNYAHIFDLLIRLRQAVDHPYLVIYSKSNPALQLPRTTASPTTLVEEKPFGTNSNDSGDEERPCTICHEDVEDVVVAKCGHDFCRECVKEYIESLPLGGEAVCLACSKPLTVDLSLKAAVDAGDVVPDETNVQVSSRSPKAVNLSKFHRSSILHRISDVHAFQSSTKIEALMQELELMRVRDPSGKAIIFSQFVNMLDIIQHRLQLGGVKCVKLSGNMSMSARDNTIKAFRDDPSVTAFLISLKAGGVALNLTVASHIFLMDPWWNPAAENQAIDRTHRLGQFKPIQATRFIVAGTVEERILKLQEKKQLIFEGTVGANVSAICRLTEEDLRFLFAS
ncbi:hypothetical protein BBJ28_00014154 [Nothophytophthora sp. Chile5]|nr:hypothetical protein BBJ28_00014154 [Nothophytophthora sp. Chile5]